MLDKKVVSLFSKLKEVKISELNDNQLKSFKNVILKVEEQCKWYNTSLSVKNFSRQIDREIKSRNFKQQIKQAA